jgi:transcriptional regulator with GAF, ATPase, and Fis domain
MAKRICRIDKHTLELCERYSWPGNIRELQNIVERSVILCSGDTFSIDAAWLPSHVPLRADGSSALPAALQDQEKDMIEAALAKSKGRVAGPRGAAANARDSPINAGVENQATWHPEGPIQHSAVIIASTRAPPALAADAKAVG